MTRGGQRVVDPQLAVAVWDAQDPLQARNRVEAAQLARDRGWL